MTATLERKKSQHYWMQHVASVLPAFCNMLEVVGSSLKMVKFEQPHVATSHNSGGQTCATSNSVAIFCVEML